MLLEDKRGDMFSLMVNFLFLFMAIAVFVAMIPALNSLLNISQQSDYLNCNGYYYNGNAADRLSYNSSLASNTIACLAIRLYLPYIAIAVLLGGVGKLLSERVSPFG